MSRLKTLLREPLVHFLALGALLFLFFEWKGGGSGPGSTRIVVTPGLVEHLASGFARTWQRPPTDAELKGLVDDYVKEEIATREAHGDGPRPRRHDHPAASAPEARVPGRGRGATRPADRRRAPGVARRASGGVPRRVARRAPPGLLQRGTPRQLGRGPTRSGSRPPARRRVPTRGHDAARRSLDAAARELPLGPLVGGVARLRRATSPPGRRARAGPVDGPDRVALRPAPGAGRRTDRAVAADARGRSAARRARAPRRAAARRSSTRSTSGCSRSTR